MFAGIDPAAVAALDAAAVGFLVNVHCVFPSNTSSVPVEEPPSALI